MVIHEVSSLGKVHVFISGASEGNMKADSYSLEDRKSALKNREKFFRKVNLSIYNSIFMDPKFTDKVEIITYKDARLKTKEEVICDALVTYTPYLILGSCFGDCLPLIVYEEEYKEIISLIHAGRANITKIIPKVFSLFFNHFYIRPKDTKIIIGPSIKKDSYVLPESSLVYGEKNNHFWKDCLEVVEKEKSKQKERLYKVDLIQVVKNIISEEGIPEENLKVFPFDTFKDKTFFSHYRAIRTKEQDKRFLVITFLKNHYRV